MKQILIVDDHPMIIMGMKMFVKKTIPDCQIHSAGTFPDTLSMLMQQHMDLILLDLSMPGARGLEMIGMLRQVQHDIRILICSGRDEIENAPNYINSGANGFIQKNAEHEEIEKALAMVMNNKKYMSQNVQKKILENFTRNTPILSNPIELLTKREKEILGLLIRGRWTKEIAKELNVKFSTVSTHKNHIFEKMQVENIVDLFKKVEQLTSQFSPSLPQKML